jgi:hypothetical protein
MIGVWLILLNFFMTGVLLFLLMRLSFFLLMLVLDGLIKRFLLTYYTLIVEGGCTYSISNSCRGLVLDVLYVIAGIMILIII